MYLAVAGFGDWLSWEFEIHGQLLLRHVLVFRLVPQSICPV